MNIVVSIDDNYALPLRVMLASLFLHNRVAIKVWLLFSELTRENLEDIRKTVEQYGGTLQLCPIQAERFSDAPELPIIPRVMYYRLLSAEALPESEERALYLDPDILILDSVLEFYDSDFEGKQIIAMPDVGDYLWEVVSSRGIERPYRYVNSGVMLLNLELMRKKTDISAIMGMIMDPEMILDFPDQDVINLYFKDDIKYGDSRYNIPAVCVHAVEGIFRQMRPSQDYCVLHFFGSEYGKPWQRRYHGNYFLLYDKYLKIVDKRQYRFRWIRYPYVFVRLAIVAVRKAFRRMRRMRKSL